MKEISFELWMKSRKAMIFAGELEFQAIGKMNPKKIEGFDRI